MSRAEASAIDRSIGQPLTTVMISAGDSIRGPGIRSALEQVDGDGRFGGHLQAAGRELAVAHRGVGVAQIEVAAGNEDRQIDDVARADLDDVHVAAVRTGGERRGHAPVGRGADAAEHRLVGDGDFIAPVDLAIPNRADVRAVGAVGPEPFAELLRVAVRVAHWPIDRADLVDRDRQRVARLGPFDLDRAGLADCCTAFWTCRGGRRSFGSGRESVFALDDDRLARLDPQPRLVVPAEFVVERAEGEAVHGFGSQRLEVRSQIMGR